MKTDSKTIRDPIHGNIKIEGVFLDLIKTPEIQRLYNIKQLGFAHLVFPGAHHTRLEHSLGTYHMATQVSDKLYLDNEEKKIITCASILHDIGHGPFSHTLESILRDTLNVDHVDLTEKLINGERSIFDQKEMDYIESSNVFDILTKHDINKKDIINIIRGNTQKKLYLSQLLHSSIDVDQLDYLIRDAYYTGVSYGLIDIERFFQTILLNDNELAVNKKGIGVIENILMARTLMYSSVYFHKTVRIAELMLSKAIEMINEREAFEFFKMTDAELINELKKMGSFQHEIATRLKYRNLFKHAYSVSDLGLSKGDLELINKLEYSEYRRKKEQELEELLNIPAGHVIIDVPRKELYQAEPRIDRTDIIIIDEKDQKKLDFYTPVAKAIRSRAIPEWIVMIVADERYRDILSKKAEKILFS